MAKLTPPKGNMKIGQFFLPKTAPATGTKRPSEETGAQAPLSKRAAPVAFTNDDTAASVATSSAPAAASFDAANISTAVGVLSVDTESFQPFALKDVYVCPYRAKGLPCKHRKKGKLQQGEFSSMDGLLQHTDKAHDGGSHVLTPYEVSPLEDGTRKVPCPKKCGRLFRTHQQANQHSQIPAKGDKPEEKGCTVANRTNIECVWKKVLACNSTPAADAKGYANHHSTHVYDPRGPYACKKNCGQYHVCLYMLQSHEEDCTGAKIEKRDTTMRFSLGSNSPDDSAEVIVIGRSSSTPPKAWAMGTPSICEGLPVWGDHVLRHFAAYSEKKFSSAILHAGPAVRTRYMPAPAVDDSASQPTEDLRWHVRRAHIFTKSILKDIQDSNKAGLTPTIVSVGLDAFTCNTRLLHTWLQENKAITFDIVFRLKALHYGMKEDLADEHGGVYWLTYHSDALRKALAGDDSNAGLVQIIASMDRLQAIKDAMTGQNSLQAGRNIVQTTVAYPSWR